MLRFALRFFFGYLLLFLVLAPAPGQDKEKAKDEAAKGKAERDRSKEYENYRRYFKKPETTMEFWAALKFELEVGKFDLAGYLLKGFIDKMPTDKELLELEESEGMSVFLRLLTIPEEMRLTDASIAVLKTNDVPEAILLKLKPIKDRKYSTEKEFAAVIDELLPDKEFGRIRDFALIKADIVKQSIVQTLRKDAVPLVERVSKLVYDKRTDPERIKKFVAGLTGTLEERSYSIQELRRAGPIAVPYLINTLLDEATDSTSQGAILTAMVRLNKDILPPLAAALDVKDTALRAHLVDVLRRRGDPAAVPYLWYLTAGPDQPEYVRDRAKDTLAFFLSTEPKKLPPAKFALTDEANRYYTKKVRFADSKNVNLWKMDGRLFVIPPPSTTASQAEEYEGLRFARQALAIDPTYRPAQIVFLSLALDKAYERVGLDQPLDKAGPEIRELLRTVNPDLVTAVLERAISERRLNVVLGAVRALGEMSEIRAAQARPNQTPALVRALDYPDRRVQIAAADALLRLPASSAPQAQTRIVEVLRRTLATDSLPKALIADANMVRAEALGKAIGQAGFEPVVVSNGRDALRRLNETSDIDVILLDPDLPTPGLPYLLAELRADINSGMMPILLLVPPGHDGRIPLESERRLFRYTSRYPNVWVASYTFDVAVLKRRLAKHIADSIGTPISEEERTGNATIALLWLKRMASGEVRGYDIRPAAQQILRSLLSDKMRGFAIEATGGLPGPMPQRALAAIVLDMNQLPEFRSQAAIELNRHIKTNGNAITRDQARAIVRLFESSDDPKLKGNVALVVGSLRPASDRTGQRLQKYVTPMPLPPAAAEGKEKAEDKEKPDGKDKAEDKDK